MVNRTRVESIIHNLRGYLGHLRDMGSLNREGFLGDPIKTGAARYYFMVSFEACVDVANHLISVERLRTPKDYRDTFKVLNDAGVLPEPLTRRMLDLAGFRNRVVHLYWEVDDDRVFDFLVNESSDFEQYATCILDHLDAVD